MPVRRAFSRAQVLQMRRAFAWGHSCAEIGRAFGITERAARYIVQGKTYSRVRDDAPDTPPEPLPSPLDTPAQRPPREPKAVVHRGNRKITPRVEPKGGS